jgi:hypothetical protein
MISMLGRLGFGSAMPLRQQFHKLGSCLALLGFFIRQFCILVSAAFALWVILNPEERRRLTARRVGLLFVLPHVVAGLFLLWWTRTHTIFHQPYAFNPRDLVLNYLYIFLTLGFFVTPLLVAFFLSPHCWKRMSGMKLSLGLATSLGLLLITQNESFPFLRNQITAWGMYLPGEFVSGTPERLFPNELLLLLTVLSVAATSVMGAGMIASLATMVQDWRSLRSKGGSKFSGDWLAKRHFSDPRTFLALFSLLYLASFALLTYPFDRYLIFLIPIVAVCVLDATREWRLPVWTATAALTAYALFAVVITLDALAWNRSIWKEARQLVNAGTPCGARDMRFRLN